MSTVAYAMADMAPSQDGRVPAGAVTVAGGCGESHGIATDANGRPHITCDICAPVLTGHVYGWASTPHGVPLTPDEHAQRELAKRDAEAGQNALMNAMVGDFMNRLGTPATTAAITAAPAAAPSLDQVLADATPEQLLAAMPPAMQEAFRVAAGQAAAAENADPAPKAAPAKAVPAKATAGRTARPAAKR